MELLQLIPLIQITLQFGGKSVGEFQNATPGSGLKDRRILIVRDKRLAGF